MHYRNKLIALALFAGVSVAVPAAAQVSFAASVPGLSSPVSFTLTNAVGSASEFLFSPRNGYTVAAGTNFIFSLQAADQFGKDCGPVESAV